MDTSESSDGCASTTVTSSSSTSGHHKVGYNKSWEKEYPWLVPIAGGSGMVCSLCKSMVLLINVIEVPLGVKIHAQLFVRML